MRSNLMVRAGAIALVALSAGCATWNEMDRSERGTATGATGGALVGAAVGGPVGAAIGAGVGGYVGHHQGLPPARSDANVVRSANASADAALVRSVQQSLNRRGFDAGPVDGQWGPSTENALRDFQRSNGLAQTGNLDDRTLSALGVYR